MKKNIGLWLMVAVLLVGGVFFVGGRTSVVHAAGNDWPPIGDGDGYGYGYGDGDGYGDGVANEYLAKSLGVTVEALNAARTKSYTAAVDDALSKKLITSDQAARLKAAGNQIPADLMRMIGPEAAAQIDFHSLLAKALGITADQLTLAAGKAQQSGLAQAVADGRLTQAEVDFMTARQTLHESNKFQETMKAAYQKGIQDAQKEGILTQTQSDALLKHVQDGSFLGNGEKNGLSEGFQSGWGRGNGKW